MSDMTLQSQKAVTAYLKSKQLLLFGFAWLGHLSNISRIQDGFKHLSGLWNVII